jgi:hypothetical protein
MADITIGTKFRYDNAIFGDLHGKVGKVTSVFTYKRPNPARSHELEIDFGNGTRSYTYPNKDLKLVIEESSNG